MKRAGSVAGSGAGSGSVSQGYGSTDPDPYQNVMDPQHWTKGLTISHLLQVDVDKLSKRHGGTTLGHSG
jgi:hypothetical protein